MATGKPTEPRIPAFLAGDALLIVDPQIDFCPGGSLGVAEGDAIMPVVNAWAEAAERAHIPIFVSRDWHPPRTTHFAEYGGVWPVHCVAGQRGADFHPDFRVPRSAVIVSKGMGEQEDAYSAFQARDEHGVPLPELLVRAGVRRLYILGLATDYCVKESALSALQSGLDVSVVPEGIRAVNLQPGDDERALEAVREAGGQVLSGTGHARG
jgi:nicotinamidase/pyrazinamidase